MLLKKCKLLIFYLAVFHSTCVAQANTMSESVNICENLGLVSQEIIRYRMSGLVEADTLERMLSRSEITAVFDKDLVTKAVRSLYETELDINLHKMSIEHQKHFLAMSNYEVLSTCLKTVIERGAF